MLKAALLSWWGWLELGVRLLRSLGDAGWSAVPRRLVLFLLVWLAFGMLNLVHWIGFLLDEILFPAYRQTAVVRPLFVVGIPRSGTTRLQRVLARDSRFTTLTLFDCILAPSITERHLYMGLGRLFAPIRGWLRRFDSAMDHIHEIGLSEPEEDFLLLLYMQSCFLTVVLHPRSAHSWHLARFDDAFPASRRRQLMHFYRRCLQKHLYFYGQERWLLSKNPSFTPFINSLREEFPDCSLIACVREPEKTVPSQLSSLLPAFNVLGCRSLPSGFRDNMIEVLHSYYRRIGEAPGLMHVEMQSLTDNLRDTVINVFRHYGREPSVEFLTELTELSADGRSYRSLHRYLPEDFGMTTSAIAARFDDVWPVTLSTAE